MRIFQRTRILLLGLIAALVGLAGGPWLVTTPTPAAAQVDEICFPDQPGMACFQEPFASFWQSNGGLAVFGYPLGPAQNERSAEANRTLLTQWTERNRLESHPDNAPPYNVLLGRMGAERLAQLGRDPFAEGREAGPQAGCLWFAETGHNVCDQLPGLGFRSYWEANGLTDPRMDSYQRSLALFGLPLTEAKMEVNPTDGRTYLTQWFERARFEWHPNKPDQFKVLLGLLGNELRVGTPIPIAPPADPLDLPGVTPVGVEINRNQTAHTLAPAQQAAVSWVRYNGILWPEVEPARGQRNWAALETVDRELQAFAEAGLTPMIVIRQTPEWARSVPASACSAPTAAAFADFAAFMGDLVARYSVPPYNVRYWEIGNEPDVDPALIDPSLPFGCWGNAADPYYGGGYVADMFKAVYPAIKAADPQAKVVLGGLLLDCDPTNPPLLADGSRKDCSPGLFLEGFLRNGGADYVDVIGYHAYTYWGTAFDPDREHPSWAHRGGALVGKAEFLREVMSRYRTNKPLLANEIGLLCYGDEQACIRFGFYEEQAIYLARTYTRTKANAIQGAAWYTLNGPNWRLGGLVPLRGDPVPAFSTLVFFGNLFDGAEFAGNVSSSTSLEGYRFTKGDTRYHVLWATAPGAVVYRLPDGTRAAYDLYGNALEVSGSSISIGKQPVVLEIR